MARVPYLSVEDLPEEQRHLLDRPINISRALANSPGTLELNRSIGRWARFRSAVDPRLRELAVVAIGVLTANRYEYAHHVHIAEEFGASPGDIRGIQHYLAGRPHGLEPDAMTVIDAARMLTNAGRLDDATWERLESALGRQAAVDLVFIVSYYNMVVRVLGALDVELEPDWAEHLDRYPLEPPGANATGDGEGETPTP